MLLPIVIYGHPVLRKVSEDIPADFPDLEKFLKDMFQTMDEADGVGLAAPQVGKSIRVFVVDGSAFAEMDPDCAGFRRAFINAHIVERDGEEVSRNEGCLSVPGIHEDVKRKNRIRMVYEDEKGERKEEVFEGIKAWIIQHEYDHLEGIVFTDHLSSLKKRLLRNKLNNISMGKFRATYKVVLPK
ncbi:peptide deformylase [Odoribacter lunatus]|uniref:peptide deformylase n=1 Tax=Odoribacter lunatus TaxID=2941335 RepID=UPI00203BFD68|nr:peptide deformylase [Odoribacter lunatus]